MNPEESNRTWPEWVAHWEAEAARDEDYARRLEIVLSTPEATMLAMLADNGTSYSYSVSRACGGEARIHGRKFHCDVFEAAFRCYRRALVDAKAIAEVVRAKADLEAAEHRLSEANMAVPLEMRGYLR